MPALKRPISRAAMCESMLAPSSEHGAKTAGPRPGHGSAQHPQNELGMAKVGDPLNAEGGVMSKVWDSFEPAPGCARQSRFFAFTGVIL